MFLECERIRCLCLVGCCYHKLSQQGQAPKTLTAREPAPTMVVEQDEAEEDVGARECCGFPMSRGVRALGVVLGENELNMANFAPGGRRIAEVPSRPTGTGHASNADAARALQTHKQASEANAGSGPGTDAASKKERSGDDCYHANFFRAAFQVVPESIFGFA
eukprot:2480364-Rhodomonas_salina.2